MTPYEAIYGQEPPSMAFYVPRTSKFHVVDRTLHSREAIMHILKENLDMAQNQMKQQVD